MCVCRGGGGGLSDCRSIYLSVCLSVCVPQLTQAHPQRRFVDEKRTLESELVRMHDGVRAERARRLEVEAVDAQRRQDVERLQEAYRCVCVCVCVCVCAQASDHD